LIPWAARGRGPHQISRPFIVELDERECEDHVFRGDLHGRSSQLTIEREENRIDLFKAGLAGVGVYPSSDGREIEMVPMLFVALWGLGLDAPLGDEIVAYARSRLGQKVGNGECTSLAVAALRQCDARRPDPVLGIWGDEVKSLRDLQPGDVLQFEDAVFVKQRVRPDGAVLTLTYNYGHHTAIVARVRKRGPKPVLVILHQNAGVAGGEEDEHKVVCEWTLEMAAKRSGSVKAYRPAADRPWPPGQPDESPARTRD
jgi:hypothetical protein